MHSVLVLGFHQYRIVLVVVVALCVGVSKAPTTQINFMLEAVEVNVQLIV